MCSKIVHNKNVHIVHIFGGCGGVAVGHGDLSFNTKYDYVDHRFITKKSLLPNIKCLTDIEYIFR